VEGRGGTADRWPTVPTVAIQDNVISIGTAGKPVTATKLFNVGHWA
jgi:hypothetical protein